MVETPTVEPIGTAVSPDAPPDLDAALAGWRRLLGDDFVVTEAADLVRRETATFATHRTIPAILRPRSSEEVQGIVRIANQHRVPIYPISSGKNWGSGSAVPYVDRCVLLDLAGLDRIREIHEEQAYATVEAGVTQRQLQYALTERGSELFLPTTSSSPDTSIVGNTMERGQCRGPLFDRFAGTCSYEVVLPTGELVHTGLGCFPGAKAAPVYRWGVGPFLDGLFSQSNLGIVTAMNLWLPTWPKHFQTFYFKIVDEKRLPEVVNALREVLQGSSIRGVFSISNPLGVISYLHQYPWDLVGGKTPLPDDQLSRLSQESKLVRLNGLGAIYSESQGVGREHLKLIRRALRGKVDVLVHVDEAVARRYRTIRTPWRWFTGIDIMGFLDFAYFKSPSLGFLDEKGALPMAYWRKRQPAPEVDPDPDRDRCGFLNTVVMVPYDGEEVLRTFQMIDEVVTRHGFEPNYSVRCSADRSLEIISFLIYDRDTPGDDERAMACHDEQLERLLAAGHVPCRLGIQNIDAMPEPEPGYRELRRRLKQTLDPNGILAPGRYEFSGRSGDE